VNWFEPVSKKFGSGSQFIHIHVIHFTVWFKALIETDPEEIGCGLNWLKIGTSERLI
jgi:hypothetical protein